MTQTSKDPEPGQETVLLSAFRFIEEMKVSAEEKKSIAWQLIHWVMVTGGHGGWWNDPLDDQPALHRMVTSWIVAHSEAVRLKAQCESLEARCKSLEERQGPDVAAS